ncbi:MAG: SDR family NAD(P)-dependent oxidoreductase [Chroococcidiopsidaceae cyanobacterium CP_BM_ER_R8_30]|nr:SDR family NAD(P)-dependent oxidoreductase [Chroococcidiopsidaceae cyanobacterium CP_BM_ER_R8_30]
MTKKARIDPSSVFLVSGGAKGITAECVIRLAQHYQCRWLLLGRSSLEGDEPTWARNCDDEFELKKRIVEDFLSQGEKPTPISVQRVFNAIASRREIKKTLSTLERAGGQAEYLSVDVTDAFALQQKLAVAVERMGPITGIIHGAGNLADKLIEKKTEQDFETVFAAKVKGLENLLSCTNASQLDYLVLFSSVSGFYGNSGQSDYAIANEILNKSAHLVKQHYPSCHVVAINWGPWDSGMVTPELKKAFAKRRIEVIPIEVGTQMLVEELATTNHNTAQVIIGSPMLPQAGELSPELRTHRIHRKLTLLSNPFLQDHVIGGHPVLPAACATSWIASTCEQFYPGHIFFSMENFKVLKGIVFDNTQASEFVMDVKEVAKTDSNEIEFEARIWSENESNKIRFHYNGQVKLRQHSLPVPTYDSFNIASDWAIPGPSLYQNGTLFHGPCFQGVEQVLNISSEKITIQCILPSIPERQQGQFAVQTFNPYIIDILLQSALIWLMQLHQLGCLPLEIKKIEQFQPIPFDKRFYTSMELQSKTDTKVVSNITAHDSQGQAYIRLEGVVGIINKRLNHLFLKK